MQDKEFYKPEQILCACGCGELKPKYSNRDRKLASRYIFGHKRTHTEEELYPEGVKECRKCKIRKPLDDFSYRMDKNGIEYRQSRCRACMREDTAEYINKVGRETIRIQSKERKEKKRKENPARFAIQESLSRWREKTPKSDLTTEYLLELFNEQEGKCYYCREEIIFCLGHGQNRPVSKTASLDKLDPKQGYRIGNVAWVSHKCNTSKLDRTEEEFYLFCERVLELAKFRGR